MDKINVSVFVDKQNKSMHLNLENGASVRNLLLELKINPVTVLITRNNELILENERLKNNDKIKILSVISGG